MSTEPNAVQPSGIFIDEDMGEPLLLQLAGGEAVVYSRRCPGQEANEDCAACFGLDAGGVLAVADGVGGNPAGGSASSILVRCMRETLNANEPESTAVRAAILDGIEEANRRILELAVGAGTTFAAAELLVDTLRPYHVGDSQILVVGQRGRVKLQTVSHSPVGYALEAGMLDDEEALHHDERHLVSNLVGSAEMRIEVGSPLALARRDTVLLGTDGLFDNLAFDEIVELIRAGPLIEAARKLAQKAGSRMERPAEGRPSKPDDLTFILYRRTGAPTHASP